MIIEDKLVYNRISDIIEISSKKYKNKGSYFLDPREQAIAKNCAKSMNFSNYVFEGGYDEAERKIFMAFDVYSEPSKDECLIKAITIQFRSQDKISHRDILGSLMGMMIKRESVGDILVGENQATFFVTENVYPIVIGEMRKIGRIGIKILDIIPDQLPKRYNLKPKTGTISSLRLDIVVSFMLNISRGKSADIIKSGLVSLNYFECTQLSKELSEGDVFSVKGHGKFVLKEVGGFTLKNKMKITCCKYV